MRFKKEQFKDPEWKASGIKAECAKGRVVEIEGKRNLDQETMPFEVNVKIQFFILRTINSFMTLFFLLKSTT